MAKLDGDMAFSSDQKELSSVDEVDDGVGVRKRAKVSAATEGVEFPHRSISEVCRKAEDKEAESGNLRSENVRFEAQASAGVGTKQASGSVGTEQPSGHSATEQFRGSAAIQQLIGIAATEQSSGLAGPEQPRGSAPTEHSGNGNQSNRETDSASLVEKGRSRAQTSGILTQEASPGNGVQSILDRGPKNAIFTKLTADVAEDRGSRHTMEDAWLVLPQGWLGDAGELRLAHFAIYDGHGGRLAAEYARAHLHANVLSAGFPRQSVDVKAAKRAITEGFKNTDEALLRESSAEGWQDGATVVSVWVLGQTVFVANLGDAKAVLARAPPSGQGESRSGDNAVSLKWKGECLKGLIVTKEHKAIFPSERARIEKAGGYVEGNGRLLGRLEVSRAFGDRNFKKVGVIAVPDIQKFELTERERFLILGCDGLWGVFAPSDAVEFVAEQLKNDVSLGMACRRLIREAVRERKCKDNCTAIVITFEHLLK